MTVTLQHLAKEAGVSVSTVSRVLNGHAQEYRISQKTEKIVREVADKLGFRPNQLARSLRSNRSALIGVVVPDISNPFFASIARDVTVDADTNGYSVLLADSRNDSSVEEKLVEQLLDRRVEGLVVCPVGVESQHLEKIETSGLPLVLVDRGFPNSKIVTVTSDHCHAAEEAARLLTARGHRAIGALQGLPGTLPNEKRLEGLRRALASCDIELTPEMIAGDNFTEQSGYESATKLLKQFPRLTALFAVATPNALGALRALKEAGRAVPDEISLVTFDNPPFVDFLSVPLSAASQDVGGLGRTASRLISEQIESGERTTKKLFTIPVEIIDRASIRDVSTN